MKKLIILVLFLSLMACGRVSKPQAPEGSTYPEIYVVRD